MPRGRGARLAIGAGAACAAMFARADSKPAAPPTPRSAPSTDLVVTGLPAVVETSRKLWADDHLCLDFVLRDLDGGSGPTHVAVTGLTKASLSALPDPVSNCASQAVPPTQFLALGDLGTGPATVRLTIPSDSISGGGAGDKAQIVIFREGQVPLKTDLTVRPPPAAAYAQAALWFLGLALPALLTGSIGLFFFNWQKRVEARNTRLNSFETFRREKRSSIRSFFSVLYQNLMDLTDRHEFAVTVDRELEAAGIMSALPAKALKAVSTAIINYERPLLAKTLAESFPEHKDLILKPVSAKETKTR